MPIVARKTKPTLAKPPVERGPRKKQGIPQPASAFPRLVKPKVSPDADH